MVHDWGFCFVHPGVLAVSDPRGPAVDPPGPGLGASGGVAHCGAGGLLTEQVTSSSHLNSVLLVLPTGK